MKQHYLFLSMVLLVFTSGANAQVTNGNFENVKPNFLPSNWGMTFLQQVVIDAETGESVGDQIQFTWCVPSMVYATTEAQTGQYAMEISNAYNATQDFVIPGMAMIFNDPEQDSPGWNPGIPVVPGDHIDMLGFYYKFLPAGNDIATAVIEVADDQGNIIGNASLDISGTNSQFQYVYIPITYTSNAPRAFMNISFSMAKEGSTPTFGSRLLIDNVVTNFAALGQEASIIDNEFVVYPTSADNELNIIPGRLKSDLVTYKIIDMQGKVVKQNTTTEMSNYVYTMDVSPLNAGMYFIHVESNAGSIIKKFIKK
ncbi:T9SS type A sorting domain-containing protein [Flavobacterium terrisoli]|uniref:T9SS type A sorting domain-containing protein n=1 Tax=Flavobacterium terrisoli TaxID=3242195 RepID=UPI002543D96E|nr:T9SS type A sorting domain-containing protein [Flavobacterium buctense]